MTMKQVVVILEHDGSGDGAVPIAVIELPDGDPANSWVIEEWLRNHDWVEMSTPEGYRWTKVKRGLYETTYCYAAISDPMTLEEAQ